MEFYCDAMNKYEHALYISGTNLPYGHSKFTHLSYQMINTLNFSKEQFSNVINHHCNYIENPIDFLKEWGNNNDNNVGNDYSKRDKIGLTSDIPNWKKAVFKNQKLKTDVYITKQLQNTQNTCGRADEIFMQRFVAITCKSVGKEERYFWFLSTIFVWAFLFTDGGLPGIR